MDVEVVFLLSGSPDVRVMAARALARVAGIRPFPLRGGAAAGCT